MRRKIPEHWPPGYAAKIETRREPAAPCSGGASPGAGDSGPVLPDSARTSDRSITLPEGAGPPSMPGITACSVCSGAPRRGRPPKADRAAPEAGEKKTGKGCATKPKDKAAPGKTAKAPGRGKRAVPGKGAPPEPAKEEAPAPPSEPAQPRDATRAVKEEVVYLNLSDLPWCLMASYCCCRAAAFSLGRSFSRWRRLSSVIARTA